MHVSVNKVIRVAAGEDAAKWRDALSAPSTLDAATVLKEDAGSWVRRARVMGRDVVVKCRALNTVARRVKHVLGMGHGHKHWRGAELLIEAAIPTGRPLALLRVRVDGRTCELLVLEFVPGSTLLEFMDNIAHSRSIPIREQHRIADAVGALSLKCMRANLYNRDHKPSNLVVESADATTKPIIHVIDCVAIRRLHLDDSGMTEMLGDLAIEPIGCSCFPRRALWMRAIRRIVSEYPVSAEVRRHAMISIIQDAAVGVEQHGDPRPRVNPLKRAGES